jgi:hypothetical protein
LWRGFFGFFKKSKKETREEKNCGPKKNKKLKRERSRFFYIG